VDPSAGLVERQRQRLVACPLPLRWATFEQLAHAPLRGVVLAHEVLDALPVERIVWDGERWRQQLVELRPDGAWRWWRANRCRRRSWRSWRHWG
jgi:SAM-dependent MidA family methyltransferase